MPHQDLIYCDIEDSTPRRCASEQDVMQGIPLTQAAINPGGHGHGGVGFFQVLSSDACAAPTLRLGGYVLVDGETIKITETGRSGVRLVNVMGPAQIKHFQVGRGEAVITSTDPSGNVARAACPRPGA